jgi:hypothetical protein
MTTSLPEILTVKQMEGWDQEVVLEWIKQRNLSFLKGDNLEKFNNAYIIGSIFLDSDVDFYTRYCHLPPGVGRALQKLADEVKKEGKFIPRT